MRLKDRVAIVVGAGQSPGEGIGIGRATALTFAREGAKVLCVDHHLESAQETADMIAAKGGEIVNLDVTIVCESPRVGPHRAAMVARIAEILGLDAARVSVKATAVPPLAAIISTVSCAEARL